jgi:hypothetical protein
VNNRSAPNARRPGQRSVDPISAALCAECQRQAQSPEGWRIARSLVAAPIVPADYAGTHEVCSWCLDLRRRGDGHERHCELGLACLRILSGGWATPTSDSLRRDLRARRPKWTNIVATILGSLLSPFAGQDDVILVPIPISTPVGAQDGLLKAALVSGVRSGTPVLRALVRSKRRSTRGSVAQIRRQIVESEYELDPRIVRNLKGKRLILVDDTVTTGITLAGVAKLLRSSGAASVMAVTIDRTISSRLRQRLPHGSAGSCPHAVMQIGEP